MFFRFEIFLYFIFAIPLIIIDFYFGCLENYKNYENRHIKDWLLTNSILLFCITGIFMLSLFIQNNKIYYRYGQYLLYVLFTIFCVCIFWSFILLAVYFYELSTNLIILICVSSVFSIFSLIMIMRINTRYNCYRNKYLCDKDYNGYICIDNTDTYDISYIMHV